MDEIIYSIDDVGGQYWQLPSGELHRLDGPAYIGRNGSMEWCQNGQLHRTDGPALVYGEGTQYWYQNDLLHRLDGPAIIHYDGRQDWWINGVQLPDQINDWLKENNITYPFDQDAQMLFLLTWVYES